MQTQSERRKAGGGVEHEHSRRKSDTQTAGMDPLLHNNVE